MKNRLILVIVAIFCAISASFANPPKLPIGSQDEFRNHALTHVSYGQVFVDSNSMDWSYNGLVTSVGVDGAYAEDVLEKLGGTEFKFRITNTSDVIRGYVYLYDSKYKLLFYGYKEFHLSDFEEGNTTFDLWIQNVPILENVQNAEVIALLPDGTSGRRFNLDVFDGRVMFQSWLAGIENALLVVRFKDGTINTYTLSNPVASSPEVAESNGSQFNIAGHHVFSDPGTVKILELWQKPTVFLELSVEKTFAIDVIGVVQEGSAITQERPYAIEVVDIVTDDVYTITLNGVQSVTLPEGEYRALFRWRKFAAPGLLYAGPDAKG